MWADLRALAFKEASGLEVKQLAFELKANQQQASLRDFIFDGTNSKIALKELLTTYTFNNKKLDFNTLRYTIKDFKAAIKPSELCPYPTRFKAIDDQLYSYS